MQSNELEKYIYIQWTMFKIQFKIINHKVESKVILSWLNLSLILYSIIWYKNEHDT